MDRFSRCRCYHIAAIAGGGNDNTPQTPSNEDPVATSEQPASNQETSEEKKDADVPTEYKNALKKAETYSKTMHMSKQGIYDQLVSEYGENFPPEAAQYAIDNLEADYKANALEKAKTYYETMNMSKEGVRDQLVSEYGEKFTQEEADYAINNLE